MSIDPHQQERLSARGSGAARGTSADPALYRIATALAYSSAIAAGVAGSLVTAVVVTLGLDIVVATIVLAASGTLVVYNVDRLRDLERDRFLAPERSRFVGRNRSRLLVLIGFASVASAVSASALPRSTWLLCASVLALGLLHRRLKRVRGIKTLYLTISWLAVTLGLPLAAAPVASHPSFESLYWVSFAIGCAILANLMASNLDRRRADESLRNVSAKRRLNPAIAVAGLGLGLAIVAPEALRAVAFIPGAELLALMRYRDTEGYVAVALDGALLVGACGAVVFTIV